MDIIEDYKNFLKKIKEFKQYMVEVEKNDIIKEKIYPLNYPVYNNNYYPIMIITYNKYIFFVNNNIWKA